MTYSQVLSVFDESGLSPEQLAPYVGLSNMTIRRWRERGRAQKISKAHSALVLEGIARLVQDGRLRASDPLVSRLLSQAAIPAFDSAMGGMGVSLDDLRRAKTGGSGSLQARMTSLLRKIGSAKVRREEVDASRTRLLSFRSLGRDWKRMLDLLIAITKSSDRSVVQKSVAYGALFYVIYPFDLIPDHIPLLGLIDDFAILAMAAGFYASGSGAPEGRARS